RPLRDGVQDAVAAPDVRALVGAEPALLQDDAVARWARRDECGIGDVAGPGHLFEEGERVAAVLVLEEPEPVARAGAGLARDRAASELEDEVDVTRLAGDGRDAGQPLLDVRGGAADAPDVPPRQRSVRRGTRGVGHDDHRGEVGDVPETVEAAAVPRLEATLCMEQREAQTPHPRAMIRRPMNDPIRGVARDPWTPPWGRPT